MRPSPVCFPVTIPGCDPSDELRQFVSSPGRAQDDAAIAGAIDTVAREAGQLDLLVNNAGFSQVGAVVDLTREDLRRQYETNVIAPVAVTSKAVPLLR